MMPALPERADFTVLSSFAIDSGQAVGIMGESGAGKSTLLSILGAMNTPTTGTLSMDGIDLYELTSEQRADFRREFLGFVFQSFHLIPYLTLLENVMLPLATIRMGSPDKRRNSSGSKDRSPDVNADNGVIHVVDSVILP